MATARPKPAKKGMPEPTRFVSSISSGNAVLMSFCSVVSLLGRVYELLLLSLPAALRPVCPMDPHPLVRGRFLLWARPTVLVRKRTRKNESFSLFQA
jgi:hypothetical protein